MIRMADGPPDEWVDDDAVITGEAVALELRPDRLRPAGRRHDDRRLVSIIAFSSCCSASRSSRRPPSNRPSSRSRDRRARALHRDPADRGRDARHGRSLGKLALGARVVRDDGGAIGFRHAFIRALIGVLEIYLTFGGLAVLSASSPRRSASATCSPAPTPGRACRGTLPPAPFGVPPPLIAWARSPTSHGCPTRSPAGSAFFAQAPELDPPRRQRLARELAAEVVAVRLAAAGRRSRAVPRRRRRPAARTRAAALGLEARRLARLDGALTGLPHGFPTARRLAVDARRDRLSSGSGRPCTGPRPARRCRRPARA